MPSHHDITLHLPAVLVDEGDDRLLKIQPSKETRVSLVCARRSPSHWGHPGGSGRESSTQGRHHDRAADFSIQQEQGHWLVFLAASP